MVFKDVNELFSSFGAYTTYLENLNKQVFEKVQYINDEFVKNASKFNEKLFDYAELVAKNVKTEVERYIPKSSK